MSGKVSRLQLIGTILQKDLKLFSRDFLFIFLTILSLVTFVTLYWVIPRDVDETIALGVKGADLRPALTALTGESEEGLELFWFDNTETLMQAVEDKDIEIGISFPDNFAAEVASGKEVRVTVYVRPSLPAEITKTMTIMVREITYAIAGFQLPVSQPSEEVIVLGVDRAGSQVPFSDRMRPLYAFMMLIMEAIALGVLISSEVQQRTLTALLSTPARVNDILAAKIILGTGVAFSEAMIITFLIQGFGASPGIVIVALLLGAVLVTGIAMIAGSAGKDLMSTMLLGMLILIPLAIPAFAVLFPGTPAAWVRYLPSYGIIKAILASSIEGAGWAESAKYLAILAGWCVVSAATGALVLRRRAVTL
jgi:ABC-2 type transport system permease protein